MSATDRILVRVAASDLLRSVYGKARHVPALGPVLQRVVHQFLPRGARYWAQIPAGLGRGLWMHADLRFELGYVNGDHEPWLQEFLQKNLCAGDCFYDVGAHTGFFSLIGARLVGAGGAVVAFEPDPENAAALRRNAERNGMDQIRVVEAAVWSATGQVSFARAGEASNRTQGRVTAAADGGADLLTLPAVTLDEVIFAQNSPPPALVKMDVEGGEWEALQGARRMLSDIGPRLLCEIHEPGQMDRFRAFLEGFGYATEPWAPVHSHYADYRQHYLRAESPR